MIFYLTSIVALLNHDVENVNMLLLIVATAITTLIFDKYPFHNNYSKYCVLLYIWVSVIFMPVFHLVQPILRYYEKIDLIWENKLLNFGIPLYLFLSISMFCMPRQSEYGKMRKFSFVFLRIKTLKRLIIFSIFLSFYCYLSGLGRMGAGDEVRLPFHLSGIINIYRWYVLPYIFIIFLGNSYLKKEKVPRNIFVYYVIWCLVEVLAWMSKSVLVYHLLPIILLLYITYRPSKGKIIRYISPLIALFLFLYPIIGVMRYADKNEKLIASFHDAKKTVDEEEEENGGFLEPVNRTFMFGSQYAQNYSYINKDELFDFSNFPALFLYGGAAQFQTFVIDGYPDGARHSSGTSGLMDPLLTGGKGLMYLIVFLLILLSSFTDVLIAKGYYAIAVIVFLKLFNYCAFINLSSFYDGIGLQPLLIELCCIYLAYRLNYKRYTQSDKKIEL